MDSWPLRTNSAKTFWYHPLQCNEHDGIDDDDDSQTHVSDDNSDEYDTDKDDKDDKDDDEEANKHMSLPDKTRDVVWLRRSTAFSIASYMMMMIIIIWIVPYIYIYTHIYIYLFSIWKCSH